MVGMKLTFLSAAELAAEVPPDVEWIVRPYVAAGSVTELAGKAKLAGKSTFLAHMIGAVLVGRPFLGQPTSATPVVFLSEQPPSSLRQTLDRAGLLAHDDLRILLWRDAAGTDWPAIVTAAEAECCRVGARLLVVDTLPQFAGLRGEQENDAGAALETLGPLQAAAAGGLAVLLARHDRKGLAEIGESARGSSAFTGAVDVVLALRRRDSARPTERTLAALSRFDMTPDEIVIELTPDGYVSLGSEDAVALSQARKAVLESLGAAPGGLTRDQLADATGSPASTLSRALVALTDSVVTTGRGVRGNPQRFTLPSAPGFIPTNLPPYGGSVGLESNPGPGPAVASADLNLSVEWPTP